jgi:glycosyltransferase involved in cell wall biosynthesis
MKKFAIISVGCNCQKFVKEWYTSISRQTERSFKCYIAVDPSIDGTASMVKNYIKRDSRFRLVAAHTGENRGALYNRYICTKRVKNPNTIIAHVDLDDSLYTNTALHVVDRVYQKQDCWLTYGSYTSNMHGNWNRKIPQEVWDNNSFRDHEWCTSALRTFKRWLWDKIDKNDFILPDGKWIKRGTDLAFMFPMLEMAGPKRVKFIKKILYYYNVYGQFKNKKLVKHERKSVKYTRHKQSYERIEKDE